MPEATITPDVPAVEPTPEPAPVKRTRRKAEAPKEFVIKHGLVGNFEHGAKVSTDDLFPGVEDAAAIVDRLLDLEAIAPISE